MGDAGCGAEVGDAEGEPGAEGVGGGCCEEDVAVGRLGWGLWRVDWGGRGVTRSPLGLGWWSWWPWDWVGWNGR